MRYLSKDILEEVITQRPSDSYKSNFGRVVLIGGNRQYGGAIIMSTEACINSGAGLTTVITDVKNHGPLHARCPEAMVVGFEETVLLTNVVEQAEVILIGPGLGLDAAAQQILKMVLAQHQKQQWLIIDGSAITLFSQGNFSLTYPEKVVFTPHQMEWQRLSHLPIEQQTLVNNQRQQAKLGSTIVLKSHRTTIFHAGEPFQNTGGNPGMATGGTGDTLAGIIAGFLAQFKPTIETVAGAVYLHSLIGDDLAKTDYVVLPTKISQALPTYMKKYAQPHTAPDSELLEQKRSR